MGYLEAPLNLNPIAHNERWHHNQNYILPTDDDEFARLQLQHDLIREMFENQLVLCPYEVKGDDVILDIGTGTAAWALNLVASDPKVSKNNAKLVCIDITDRLFPTFHPENISFQMANVLNLPLGWTNRFTFVHQRLLIAALKKDEWTKAVMEVFRVTKAGGWAQFCEANLSEIGGCRPACARFMEIYDKLEAATGIDFLCSLKIGRIMEEVGFVNVKAEIRTGKVGGWDGELGEKHKRNIMGLFKGFKTTILKLGGFGLISNEQEFDVLLDEMEEEWKKPGSTYAFYVITGQKPQVKEV